MSRRQLKIFLEAINLGNGCKFKTVDWIPKTMSISTGHKPMADRLQALCVINGYRCNVSTESYNRNAPIYIMRICDKTEAHVGGVNSEEGRSKIEKSVKTELDNHVWCVTVPSGNIVTRRNGKVAIIGNCGRVLRPSPSTNKVFATVLDHGNCISRFGFPDDIVTLTLDDGKVKTSKEKKEKEEKEEPKPKECPVCKYLMRVGMKVCVGCGWTPKPKSAQAHTDEDLVEITRGKPKPLTKKAHLALTPGQEIYAQLKHHAEARGYKEGWSGYTYKDLFGRWPSQAEKTVLPMPPTAELLSWLRSKQIAKAKGRHY